MAVIIQRDNNPQELSKKSTLEVPKKNHFFDTFLLYIVGFFGLVGSIYLLYLSNLSNNFDDHLESNTTLFINDRKAITPKDKTPVFDIDALQGSQNQEENSDPKKG